MIPLKEVKVDRYFSDITILRKIGRFHDLHILDIAIVQQTVFL